MKTSSFARILFACMIFFSCEDVIDLKVPDGDILLVVDGWLYDQPGELRILLSTTANYFNNDENPAVTDATVTLFNENGPIMDLDEYTPGQYTANYTGQAGETYHIYIQLANGEEYQSIPEKLCAVSGIDTIISEYKEQVNFENDEGYFVSIDTKEPPEIGNYYRWKQYLNGNFLNKPDDILIASDEFVNGNAIVGLTINIDPLELGDHFRVQQLSLSQSAFEFLSKLELQTANVGSMFDAPPIAVKGNIIPLHQTKKQALGYFGASGLSEREIIIN
jgi:hypothetical protein